jgi:hypothetical protein
LAVLPFSYFFTIYKVIAFCQLQTSHQLLNVRTSFHPTMNSMVPTLIGLVAFYLATAAGQLANVCQASKAGDILHPAAESEEQQQSDNTRRSQFATVAAPRFFCSPATQEPQQPLGKE